MPIHDFQLVPTSTFHDFHLGWGLHLKEALNDGLLPSGYYAQTEQHFGRKIADVLTLHSGLVSPGASGSLSGGVALADAPITTVRRVVMEPSHRTLRRTVAIRHTSGHRIVALIEVLSPGNKSSADNLAEFVRKAVEAIEMGIHFVVLDVLRPGRHDPNGIHAVIQAALSSEGYTLPAVGRLTFVSYDATPVPVAYLEHPSIGEEVPGLPLFLSEDRYIPMPLGAAYARAYRGVPEYWREVLEGKRVHDPSTESP